MITSAGRTILNNKPYCRVAAVTYLRGACLLVLSKWYQHVTSNLWSTICEPSGQRG